MKQIVTIDFDIIMGPSIGIYNNWVGGEDTTVDNIIKQFSCLSLPDADLDKYRLLTHFINSVDADKISFITRHREMERFVSEFDEPIELVNIDHHHDIDYFGKDTEEVLDGNWVKYYFDNNKISKYCWINNVNSDPPTDEVISKYPHEHFYFSQEILDELHPDKLILCLSPEWVPSIYHPLFSLWRELK